MTKRAFTLIEVLISIALLSIIVIFLYQALDMTKQSNLFFNDKLKKTQEQIDIKKIFFNDISYSDINATTLTQNNDKQTILQLNTTNTYHNSFYTNITYLVSKENNLLRCESMVKFDKNKLNDSFFDKAYIDTIASNVKKFKVVKVNTGQYAIYLQFMNKDEKATDDMMFAVKSMKR